MLCLEKITLKAAMQSGWVSSQSSTPASVWIRGCRVSVILRKGLTLRPLLGLLKLLHFEIDYFPFLSPIYREDVINTMY